MPIGNEPSKCLHAQNKKMMACLPNFNSYHLGWYDIPGSVDFRSAGTPAVSHFSDVPVFALLVEHLEALYQRSFLAGHGARTFRVSGAMSLLEPCHRQERLKYTCV